VQSLRFAAVGAVGFCVDGGLLFVLHRAGMDVLLARAFSFPIAVLVTFCLNRTLTFKRAPPARSSALLVRYSVVQVAGALVNLAIFFGLVQWLPAWRALPLLSLAVAAAFSWLLTYLGSRFVFEGSLR